MSADRAALSRRQGRAKQRQPRKQERTMIRCVRIWTGDDRNSHFEEGVIDLEAGQRGDVLSDRMATTTISFEETASGGAFAWHDAPIRQLVITLSGTLDFQTREGKHFLIRPGDGALEVCDCWHRHRGSRDEGCLTRRR